MDEIKNLILSLIDKETIADAVREEVRIKVNEKFDYCVMETISNKISKVIKDKADSYIREEIERVMESKVRVDDGWGSVKEYGSFENYVRYHIGKELRSKWEVEKEVRRAVDDKLKKYLEKELKSKQEDRTDNVLKAVAEDILEVNKENENGLVF